MLALMFRAFNCYNPTVDAFFVTPFVKTCLPLHGGLIDGQPGVSLGECGAMSPLVKIPVRIIGNCYACIAWFQYPAILFGNVSYSQVKVP